MFKNRNWLALLSFCHNILSKCPIFCQFLVVKKSFVLYCENLRQALMLLLMFQIYGIPCTVYSTYINANFSFLHKLQYKHYLEVTWAKWNELMEMGDSLPAFSVPVLPREVSSVLEGGLLESADEAGSRWERRNQFSDGSPTRHVPPLS